MIARILDMLRQYHQEMTVLIALASAIFSYLSAKAAKRAAVETRRASQGSLFSSLVDAYGSPEMLEAMTSLAAFKSKHGKHFTEVFRKLRMDDYSAIQEIDQARRRVSTFFQKVYILNKDGFLDDRALKDIAAKGQVEFFREVVEPLEAVLNPSYDTSSYEGLGSLYGIKRYIPPMANP